MQTSPRHFLPGDPRSLLLHIDSGPRRPNVYTADDERSGSVSDPHYHHLSLWRDQDLSTDLRTHWRPIRSSHRRGSFQRVDVGDHPSSRADDCCSSDPRSTQCPCFRGSGIRCDREETASCGGFDGHGVSGQVTPRWRDHVCLSWDPEEGWIPVSEMWEQAV